MEEPKKTPPSSGVGNSLESPSDTVMEPAAELSREDSLESVVKPPADTEPAPRNNVQDRLRRRVHLINVYFVVFVVILIVVIIGAVISVMYARRTEKQTGLSGQTLSSKDLAKLKTSDTKVGDPKQTLTVESNSIFNGKVLIRDNLDVAGAINVGGPLSLPGLTVSGTSNFDSIQIGNELRVGGNTTLQGQLNVQKGITVSGGASFGGSVTATSITINQLQLSGDLTLSRHIVINGAAPSVSGGTGTGSGGTVSISGSDTAGTVTVNIGTGPVAGVLANITFVNAFKTTPHISVTPVGSATAGLNYYVSRTANGFSIATTNAAPSSQTVIFDYIIFD